MKTTLLCAIFIISTFCINSQTALNFDGVDDYVLVPNGGALNNLQTGTIELWVKWNSTNQDPGASSNTYGAIMARQNDGLVNNQILVLNTSNPDTAKIIWKPYYYTNTVLTSTSSPLINSWVHIAIVYTSGDHKMYINGNLEATSTETGTIANNSVPLTIGAWIDDGHSYSISSIDAFRVWNTLRTDAEIFANYNKCLQGNETGLVMLLQFEEGSGSTVTDLSGNSNNGTLTNMDEPTAWVTGYNCKQKNLVAYYPFNGNANDESGNSHNGTVYGATLTTDRNGSPESAYYFDGVSNYISIPDNSNINIQTGESISISFWTKHNAQNNAKYMISKYKGTSGEQSYAIGTGSIGDSYSWYEFSPSGIESRGTIDLNDNNWHNITSVFKSGESVTIYVDGVLDISHPITYAGSIINTRDLTIGCGSNLAQFYKGFIDDIKIYKKALTVQEIENEINALVAYYPFNGNANDESGNSHNGTVYGATLTTDRNGSPDSAYYFDGNNNYIDLGDWENGGPMSFVFWARWDALNHWSRIIDIGNGTRNDDIMVGTYQSSDEIAFYVNKGTYSNYKLFSTPAIILNQWDFYVATVDENGVMKIYKNGVMLEELLSGYTPNKLIRTEQYLGRSLYLGDSYYRGAIDELRIYQTALTSAQIGNLYESEIALSVEKFDNTTECSFYVYDNTLYFKNIQDLTKIKNIEIYNMLGQKVFKTSKINNEVSLRTLPIGIYVLKVNNLNSNSQTLRFLSN